MGGRAIANGGYRFEAKVKGLLFYTMAFAAAQTGIVSSYS